MIDLIIAVGVIIGVAVYAFVAYFVFWVMMIGEAIADAIFPSQARGWMGVVMTTIVAIFWPVTALAYVVIDGALALTYRRHR